ncbi:FecR family protein [Parapedobacter tibetensis]|uniref:FecR family protein n=1 Tax=Parapedobacter tibetensis TaxID=2972951 RepID=UPI00214DC893|nr:FecR domain-containing protein [Parapedobacter tibetensis]
MNRKKAEELLHKYNNGHCTEVEKALVEAWFLEYANKNSAEPTQETTEELQSHIWDRIDRATSGRRTNNLIRFIPYAVAASVLLAIGVYYFPTPADHPNPTVGDNTITIGKKNGRFVLDGGDEIILDELPNPEIIAEKGVIVKKDSTGDVYLVVEESPSAQFNVFRTEKGEELMIELADGSRVWLNAESEIRFNADFLNQGYREVYLTGEGYFDVTSNKDKPFKVISNHQELLVLGTRFNVSAYPENQNIVSTLVHGVIKIDDTILHPGQQSTRNAEGAIAIEGVDTEEFVSWKDGYFTFNGSSIQDVMAKLSRWYDCEVEYDGTISQEKIIGTISKKKNIEDALKTLQRTGIFRFKIEGRRVIVMT